ncbi:MAG: hypothetical protein LBB78_05690, partial [Spirochaetaceae bacterium]|nr:hypothetical protein [Spirochaetaceae bacterium]
MRQLRVLGQDVWYEVRSRVNNREPLFRRGSALAIFARVFRETGLRFRSRSAACGLKMTGCGFTSSRLKGLNCRRSCATGNP